MKSLPVVFTFFLSALFLFPTSPMLAQLSIGIKGGVNGAVEKFSTVNLYLNPPSTFGYYKHTTLMRSYGGLFINYRMKKRIAFQAEIILSAEGDNLKNETTGVTYKARQTYINLPLMVQYRFFPETYIEAGPFFGFLLAATSNYNATNLYNATTFNNKTDYKGTQSGIAIGLGHEFRQGILRNFGINIRALHDLSTVAKSGSSLIGEGEIKNRSINIGISYKWPVTRFD